MAAVIVVTADRKSTRLNSSHTEIYTLSLHDALPISPPCQLIRPSGARIVESVPAKEPGRGGDGRSDRGDGRSEEHTSELQSHRDLHSFPTRRSSDLSTLPIDTSIRCSDRRVRPRQRARAWRRWPQ